MFLSSEGDYLLVALVFFQGVASTNAHTPYSPLCTAEIYLLKAFLSLNQDDDKSFELYWGICRSSLLVTPLMVSLFSPFSRYTVPYR